MLASAENPFDATVCGRRITFGSASLILRNDTPCVVPVFHLFLVGTSASRLAIPVVWPYAFPRTKDECSKRSNTRGSHHPWSLSVARLPLTGKRRVPNEEQTIRSR